MNATGAQVARMLGAMAEAVAAQKEYLTDLDAAIGDADHGINLNRGFAAVAAQLPELEGKSAGEILKAAGMTLVSTVGGASGPLYGTAFMAAGMQAGEKDSLTLADGTSMLRAALDGVIRRGKAAVGDKTLLDTLAPVVEFLESPDAGSMVTQDVIRRALDRARQGMESTRDIMALKGRASFLKERSAGHLDPGAVSCHLLLSVAAQFILG